ncbi:ribosomal protein S18-alanine N-acetyltransferase [Stackebrandtia nassauensis]|uniref:[Ribosomal protein bS18]-alanine N-acetyltransferase n=1 Tax=Stackebrandtia nassauensis (strain DSM 44728 / CIP 108903 / NRRL B-16338 / NBRC 102104 / LLR-40K-21) TaxID=446470 RepID=D3Q5X8_STANL|nr:ribosomal protein S18-alanine N-acetyltransferase [Stackebrandtia nassauensis]ADD40277.1 ribosomal-protein-alanine acetyltransferase [Stackebrandtia nassauensis DSM 44728]
MPDWDIAPLRWWHIEQLLPIEDELFGAEAWNAAMFWSELAAGHYYRVVLDDERVLGYAGLALSGDDGWVNNIAVRKAAQRRGVARALLNDLIGRAEGQGVRRLALEVAVDNAAAQRLYDAFGFEGVAIRKGYYQPSNTDAVVMMKELRQ